MTRAEARAGVGKIGFGTDRLRASPYRAASPADGGVDVWQRVAADGTAAADRGRGSSSLPDSLSSRFITAQNRAPEVNLEISSHLLSEGS